MMSKGTSSLMNRPFLLYCLLLLSLSLTAQQRGRVSGTVRDAESGETLIGVAVYRLMVAGIAVTFLCAMLYHAPSVIVSCVRSSAAVPPAYTYP